MSSAKDLIVKPISSKDANEICKRIHYSGKVTNNSQLHFGIFLRGSCEGVMQFGPGIDKSKLINLVHGTTWNGFMELNRMAFSSALPKNSESRAMGYVFRLMRKQYPHIKWIVSFSDAAQCGDGAIYRSVGFDLTQINPNKSMWRMPDGDVICQLAVTIGSGGIHRKYGYKATDSFGTFVKRIGATLIPGYQLRYIKIIDETWLNRKNYTIIPYSKITELGIGMYRGEKILRASSVESSTADIQSAGDGESPIVALHLPERE